MKKTALICVMLLGITACSSSVDLAHQPAPTLSNLQPWWRGFQDPLINDLVTKSQHDVETGNLDVRIAAARIDAARALREGALAQLWPDIAVTGGNNRANLNTKSPQTQSQAGLSATWDIDLFGANHAAAQAADARFAATKANAEDVQRLLTADLTSAIIEWHQAHHIQTETNNLLAAQRDQVALFTSRAQAGLIDDTLVTRAQAQYAQTATQIPIAEAAAKTAQYQIEYLLGMPPNTLEATLSAHRTDAPIIIPQPDATTTISLDSLRARPDIRAAALALVAAQQDLRETEANLWPKLSLSAFFGVQDTTATALSNPAWSLAGAIAAPLFNFGRLRQAVAAADARTRIAALEYEQTVLRGLQEAHTALASYLNGINAITEQQTALHHRRQTVALARTRFERGLADMTDLTTAQAELDQATLALIDRQTTTAIAWINLQKALGQ